MTGSDGSPAQNDAQEARYEAARSPRRAVWVGNDLRDEDDLPNRRDVED